MDALINELKTRIIEALKLADLKPEDIDADAPLFGEGLGLDSIDALELMLLLEKNYGIKLKNPAEARRSSSPSGQWPSISRLTRRSKCPRGLS